MGFLKSNRAPLMLKGDIYLEPPTMADAFGIAEAANHEAVSRRLSNIPFPYGVADAFAWLDSLRDKEGWFWIIKRDGDVVGVIHLVESHLQKELEVGYWVTPSAQGVGVAKTALAIVLDELSDVLPYDCVTARIAEDNKASQAVLNFNGFSKTTEFKKIKRPDGEDIMGRVYRRKL